MLVKRGAGGQWEQWDECGIFPKVSPGKGPEQLSRANITSHCKGQGEPILSFCSGNRALERNAQETEKNGQHVPKPRPSQVQGTPQPVPLRVFAGREPPGGGVLICWEGRSGVFGQVARTGFQPALQDRGTACKSRFQPASNCSSARMSKRPQRPLLISPWSRPSATAPRTRRSTAGASCAWCSSARGGTAGTFSSWWPKPAWRASSPRGRRRCARPSPSGGTGSCGPGTFSRTTRGRRRW